MACVTLGALVLTATLFGSQQLHVDRTESVASQTKTCEIATGSTDSANANANLILKNASGKSVYESKVQVQRFQFFESTESGDYKGGVAPANSATFIVKYPLNKETNTAVTADLKTLDGTFHESASLTTIQQKQIAPKTRSLIILGLK